MQGPHGKSVVLCLVYDIVTSIMTYMHNKPGPLNSCLASKQWVLRTRKYLFEKIEFQNLKVREAEEYLSQILPVLSILCLLVAQRFSLLRLQKGTFRFARSRHLYGWRSRVTHVRDGSFPFQPHVLFETVRPSRVLKLICSFPLLEDLGISYSRGETMDKVGWASLQTAASPYRLKPL